MPEVRQMTSARPELILSSKNVILFEQKVVMTVKSNRNNKFRAKRVCSSNGYCWIVKTELTSLKEHLKTSCSNSVYLSLNNESKPIYSQTSGSRPGRSGLGFGENNHTELSSVHLLLELLKQPEGVTRPDFD